MEAWTEETDLLLVKERKEDILFRDSPADKDHIVDITGYFPGVFRLKNPALALIGTQWGNHIPHKAFALSKIKDSILKNSLDKRVKLAYIYIPFLFA